MNELRPGPASHHPGVRWALVMVLATLFGLPDAHAQFERGRERGRFEREERGERRFRPRGERRGRRGRGRERRRRERGERGEHGRSEHGRSEHRRHGEHHEGGARHERREHREGGERHARVEHEGHRGGEERREEPEAREVKFVVADGSSRGGWGRDAFANRLRMRLREDGVLGRTREFAEVVDRMLRRGRRADAELLAEAARDVDADFVIGVRVASERQLLRRRAGLFAATRYTANVRLIDANTGEVRMVMRSRFRNRREAEGAAQRIMFRSLEIARFGEGGAEGRFEEGGELRLEAREEGGFEEGREGVGFSAKFQSVAYTGGTGAAAFRLEPELEVTEGVGLYAETSFFYNYDNAPNFEQMLDDVAIGARLDDLLPGVAIQLAAEFPTGPESRELQNIVTLAASGGIERTYGWLTPFAELEFKKFFPRIEPEAFEEIRLEREEAPPFMCATSIQPACPFLGEFPPNYLVAVEAGLNVDMPWVEGLSATISLGYEMIQFLEAEHNIEGRIEARYQLNPSLGLMAGTITAQPLGGEGSSPFPFFDFGSPEVNYTAFYAGLTVGFGVGGEEE